MVHCIKKVLLFCQNRIKRPFYSQRQNLFVVCYNTTLKTISPVTVNNSYLIIFRLYLEIRLGMLTYRTNLRRFLADADMAAIDTLPDNVSIP